MTRASTAGASNAVDSKNTMTAATAPPIRGMSPAPQTRPTQPIHPASPVVVAATKPAAQPMPAAQPRPAANRPTHEQIGRRAYEIYLDRCQRGQPGNSQSDWAQAEAELNKA